MPVTGPWVSRSRRVPARLAGLAAAVGLAGCGAGAIPAPPVPPAPPSALATVPATTVAVGPPATFVALDDRSLIGNQAIALYDSRTAKVISKLLPGTLDGMSVVSLAVEGSDFLWVTYNRGPVYANGSLGGDPQPDSCANDVVRLNLATGRSTTVLSTGDNEQVTGAWPSPNGQLYVLGVADCASSYFNTHFMVVDTTTGRSWTIGAALSRCHTLSAPAWTQDSRSLVVAYGSANPIGDTPAGACPQWNPARLVVVDALTEQGGMSGASASADPSCELSSTAAMVSGPVGIEHCNASSTDSNGQYIDGPARLVVFNPKLRVEARVPLGECNDGSELAADQTGGAVLLTAYLYCPGTTSPMTALWSYTASRLTPLARVPGDADLIADITW